MKQNNGAPANTSRCSPFLLVPDYIFPLVLFIFVHAMTFKFENKTHSVIVKSKKKRKNTTLNDKSLVAMSYDYFLQKSEILKYRNVSLYTNLSVCLTTIQQYFQCAIAVIITYGSDDMLFSYLFNIISVISHLSFYNIKRIYHGVFVYEQTSTAAILFPYYQWKKKILYCE